uniref:Aryl hydrocarbon receptor n=1 Tax=Latimeria chalumnae TaxID=7897 RepID=H3A0G0_LATCH
QSDVIHQSVFDLIHTEDRTEFQRQLHWALNPAQSTDTGEKIQGDIGLPLPVTYYTPEQLPPENTTFLERNFVCRLRCLLDNSSGFLAMNFQGRLKFLHGQNRKGKDGSIIPPQLALFTVATPLQPPSILEIRTKNLIFRTRHKLDFTPIGCDTKGKIVLGYTEAELCMRGTGYQFIHAADMMYCAENHVRMIKTGESGMTVFRLLTKGNQWTWVQANARLVYKNGRPDSIIATQRPLTEEEGTEHLQKRNMQLPFNFATGEAVLYEASFMLPALMDPLQPKVSGATGKGASATLQEKETIDPNSLLGAMLKQDESVYFCAPASSRFSFDRSLLNDLADLPSIDWQDNILPVSDNNIMKQEQTPCTQGTTSVAVDGATELTNNKENELYNIMKSFGIGLEDLELIQQDEEFFRAELDCMEDIGDIDVADEILTYVQEALRKRPDCMFSGGSQQKPLAQSSSCMVQQQQQQNLQQQQQMQLQQQQKQQQQLCQKMKHMQVNGMFTNWNAINGVLPTYQQPQLQQQSQQYWFLGLENNTQDYQYKTELNPAPSACRQEFMPYQQGIPGEAQPSNMSHLDFPIDNLEMAGFTPSSSLEQYLDYQQGPERSCGMNPQSTMVTQQTCYTGAVSMYQCLPEAQPAALSQAQYNPVISGQQQFLDRPFQNGFNGANIPEAYPGPFNTMDCTQPATQPLHNNPIEPRPYSDLSSSGFM